MFELFFSIKEQFGHYSFYYTKAKCVGKENKSVIVINSIFEMGTLEIVIGINTTGHIIKNSWTEFLFKCALASVSSKI